MGALEFASERQQAIGTIDAMKEGEYAVIVVHTKDEDIQVRYVGGPCDTMVLGMLEQAKFMTYEGDD